MDNKSCIYSPILSSMMTIVLHPMIIIYKNVFGIVQDEYKQNKQSGKHYIQSFIVMEIFY